MTNPESLFIVCIAREHATPNAVGFQTSLPRLTDRAHVSVLTLAANGRAVHSLANPWDGGIGHRCVWTLEHYNRGAAMRYLFIPSACRVREGTSANDAPQHLVLLVSW